MRSFEEADPGAWEAAAPSTQPNQWDTLLDQVTTGKIMRIPFPDDPDKMRGTRISLGRRATQRGIGLEFRKQDDALLVQQKPPSEETTLPAVASAEPEQQPKTERRGRKRKAAAEEQEYAPTQEAAAGAPEEVAVEEG